MLTIKQLRARLSYDPKTGDLVSLRSGRVIGYLTSDGYLQCKFALKNYQAHRVAWALHHGYWPKQIDHKNGIRHDNRIENLREATHSQNAANSRVRNENGFPKGVRRQKDRKGFRVQFSYHGQRKHFGYYPTVEEATVVAAREHKNLFGEFSRYDL